MGKSKQAVSKDLQALEEFGYIEITPQYRKDGSQRGNLYRLLFDLPRQPDVDPHKRDDDTGQPQILTPRQPGSLPPSTSEVDALTTHINDPVNAPEEQKGDPIPDKLDIPEFIKTWSDFKEHRKQIKKKMSDIAIARMLKKLGRYPVEVAIQMLDTSIENGWQGVFEPKNYPEKKSNNGFWTGENKLMGRHPGESDTEYQERRRREMLEDLQEQ